MAKKISKELEDKIIGEILGAYDAARDLHKDIKNHKDLLEAWDKFEQETETVNAYVTQWLATPVNLAQDIFESLAGIVLFLEEPIPERDPSSPLSDDMPHSIIGTFFLTDFSYIAQALRVYAAVHPRPPLEVGEMAKLLMGLVKATFNLSFGKQDERAKLTELIVTYGPEILFDAASTHAWAKRQSEDSAKKIKRGTSAKKKQVVLEIISELQQQAGSSHYPTRFAIRRALDAKGVTIENDTLKDIRKEWHEANVGPSGPSGL